MTLYDIDQAIMSCVDPETGEIIDTEKLDYLSMERDSKIENIGLWIKDLKAEADAIKNEIANLQKRKKVAENKAESLKNYLEYALDGQKFKTARLSVSYRRSESVNVTDPTKLPEDLIETIIDIKPNKTEIKKAIKAGLAVDGAELIEKTSIQVR